MRIKKNIIFIISSFLILAGCNLFKGSKTPTGIEFKYNTSANINYGYSFSFKTVLVYSNGKTKNISGKEELDITIEGGDYNNGSISLPSYPTSFQKDTIKIEATYTNGDLVFKKSIAIPYNYKGDLKLDFSGNSGDDGEKGSNGGTSMIFGYGKDGDAGGQGKDGYNGSDLLVHIWKDEISQLYFIRVTDINADKMYFFKNQDSGYGIKLDITGGKGGKGGNGGDGGDGKDGRIKKEKKKEPGDGGNGGSGGNGGNGGNGGSVYVFIHPNAAEIQSRIAIYNFGGEPGIGGNGGKAGLGGKPLEGQNAGTDGIAGNAGVPGVSGNTGEAYEISVEEFDIEY